MQNKGIRDHKTPPVAALAITCLLGAFSSSTQAQDITQARLIHTVAGNGTEGYRGDGDPATSAELKLPFAVAVDSAGNLYIADTFNNVVRRVDLSGNISTVAGNGTRGYSGDGGPAISAELGLSRGLALDSAGNLYIADGDNSRIRKVDLDGNISTVAGKGTSGYSGDGGPATSAEFNSPSDIAVDRAGNLYIADTNNNVIRKVDLSGKISTVAGNGTQGYSGDGGPAISAELATPYGLALDSSGSLYIVDTNNQRIRKVDLRGHISTVAGNGTYGYSGDGGPATSAELESPFAIAVDRAGDLYIADSVNNVIRKVDLGGTISTIAGNGTYGYSGDGGPAASAELKEPSGIAVNSAGNLYVADTFNNRVRQVYMSAAVNFGPVNIGSNSRQDVTLSINTALTLASVQASGDYSVLNNSCSLNTPLSSGTICTLQVQFAPAAPGQRWFSLAVTDSNSDKYSFGLEGIGMGSALAFTPGIIHTVAGDGTQGYTGNGGPATSAELKLPYAVIVDSTGNQYIADTLNNVIRKVATSGNISTIAGNGTRGYSGDGGPATSAELGLPWGLALDSAGNLYIADSNNSRIRRVDLSGIISTVAGNGAFGYSGDGGPATAAQLNGATGVVVDSVGNLYIADLNNNVIRKVDLSGKISTIAGNGTQGYSGDSGPATSAELAAPYGLALDSAGNLYIADTLNQRIRKVDLSGNISTVAGDGASGYSGDGGPATSAELAAPYGLALDSAGNLYIADTLNQRIRKVDLSGNISTVAGDGTYGYSGDGAPATSAEFEKPYGIAVSGAGNLYIADNFNNRIRQVTVTSAALSFGSSYVGQSSAAQNVAVSDVGNAPLHFTSFSLSPNFQSTAVGDDCVTGTPLNPGASCNLGALFAPHNKGNPLTGTLTVIDDAFNSPQAVNLSGIGLPSPVTTTVTFSVNPAIVGQAVTITATMTANSGTPAGIVTFYDGSTKIGAGTLSGGTATFTTSVLAVGAHDIKASFPGNATYSSSSGTAALNVTYQIVALYDQTAPNPSGTTIPIKLRIENYAGTNFSSSRIVMRLTPNPVSPSPPGGQPSGRVRLSGSMYILYLTTYGYPNATYTLSFTLSGDPITHSVRFVIQGVLPYPPPPIN